MVVRELITLLGFKLEDGPQKQYDKQIDRTKEKSNALATAGRGIGIAYKVAAAAVAVGIGWISKNIITATLEMEGYRSQIQAFTGDAESAAETLAELRDKTIDPLFGTGNLVNAYKGLRTIGMGSEESSRMIDVLGDVANGSAENFNALNNVLIRAASTGKVNTMTMRQLAQAGLGAQDIAYGLGISVEKLNADLESGKIGFNELTRAMEGTTKEGGRFYMNAANQALTLGGSIKIIQDTISSLGDAIGEKVAPALANLITYINNLIGLGEEGLINFGAKAFDYLIHVISQVIIFFEVLQMRMKKYGGAFAPLKALFADVFGFLKTVAESARPVLMNLSMLILTAFKPIQAFVRPVLEALKPIIQKVFGFFAKILGGLVPIVNGLTPLFERLGQIVGSLIGPILGIALAIKGVNTAISIGKGAIAAVNSIRTAYGLLTGTMSIMKAASEGNRLAMILLDAQMLKSKAIILAKAAATKIAAIATKIWSVAQAIFNAIMAANPIALIIIGVMALIAGIILLVKNWDKVGPAIMKALAAIGNFFKMIGSAIAGFFKMIWNATVGVFKKIIAFVKNNALNIVNVLVTILFPLAGIIMALVRLIIKHWDTIGPAIKKSFAAIGNFFKTIGSAIGGFFKTIAQAVAGFFIGLWSRIVGVFKKIVGFVKANALNIVNVIVTILFPLAGIVMALVRLIIKHWDTIKAAIIKIFTVVVAKVKVILNKIIAVVKAVVDRIKAVWETIWTRLVGIVTGVVDGIKNAWQAVWSKIVDIVLGVIEGIKTAWSAFTGFITGLWDGIKSLAASVWEGIKNIFIGVVDGIKNVWNGLINFFTGLWEAIRQGPSAVFEYFQNAFFGLFENIKEKFFGFINVIKDGWDKVKGFFGGIKDTVVNFVTGTESEGTPKPAESPKPVNDLILTPQGGYSTHPDDYIMAMKKPGDLIDALMRYMGGPQPVYAGAGGGSLIGSAMSKAAAQNTYNSSSSNVSNVTAPINVNVNASGMTPDMASVAVRRGVEDALRNAINGSRGSIPSPEARRN